LFFFAEGELEFLGFRLESQEENPQNPVNPVIIKNIACPRL